MTKTHIDPEDAEQQHGIFTNHEKMENSELRFRLMSKEGDGYIRTVSQESSGWQNSHFHREVWETYIVQNGHVVVATLNADEPEFHRLGASDVFTVMPLVPHNVYLAPGTTLHTVKHGNCGTGKDWYSFPRLDELTKPLDARELAENSERAKRVPLDERYGHYVSIYNNFDNLIWRTPGYMSAGLALFLAFIAAVLKGSGVALAAPVWAGVFLLAGIVVGLGCYGMARLRKHHTMLGRQIKALEPDGYFHLREASLGFRTWPPAPFLFICVFSVVSIVFFFTAALCVFEPTLMKPVLGNSIQISP